MLITRNEEKNTVFYSYLACVHEYIQLEYVRIHVINRVNQAENGIHIRVVAPQEYVNIYSTRKIDTETHSFSIYTTPMLTPYLGVNPNPFRGLRYELTALG